MIGKKYLIVKKSLKAFTGLPDYFEASYRFTESNFEAFYKKIMACINLFSDHIEPLPEASFHVGKTLRHSGCFDCSNRLLQALSHK